MTLIGRTDSAAGCEPVGASVWNSQTRLKGRGKMRDWLAGGGEECVPVPILGLGSAFQRAMLVPSSPAGIQPHSGHPELVSGSLSFPIDFLTSPPPYLGAARSRTIYCFRLRSSGAHVHKVRCAPRSSSSLYLAQSGRRRPAVDCPLHPAVRKAQPNLGHALSVIPTNGRNLSMSCTPVPNKQGGRCVVLEWEEHSNELPLTWSGNGSKLYYIYGK
jgi:hypothetical protein